MSWQAFEGIAEEYDKWYKENAEIYEKELECVKEAIKGTKLLDVGSGTGAFCLKGAIALDPSLSMLKVARKKGCEAVMGIAEMLPFRSKAFDNAYFVTSLCFVNDRDMAISEAKRVAKEVVACILVKDSELVKKYEEKGKRGHRIYKYAKFMKPEELGRIICKPFDFFACVKIS